MTYLVIGPQCWGRGKTRGDAARSMRRYAPGDWRDRRLIPCVIYESADPSIAVDADGVVGWDSTCGPTKRLGEFTARFGRYVTFDSSSSGGGGGVS